MASAPLGATNCPARRPRRSTGATRWRGISARIAPARFVSFIGAGPRDRAGEILSELSFLGADATVVPDIEALRPATHLRLPEGVPEELSPVLAALPLAQLGFHLTRKSRKRQRNNFPSEQAKIQHYTTIHRATTGEPA